VSAADTTLQRTALHARHAALGAKLVPFAGWDMPVQYSGIREEHLAVRRSAGIFDVSHMGEIGTKGPGARRFLQRILSNDVEQLAVGGAQYSVLCRDDGGIIDDLFTYRPHENAYLTVTNASNHEKDLAWFQAQAAGHDDVEIVDAAPRHAMLAVQGPDARGHVERLADRALPARFHTAHVNLLGGGARALVCGTGYTGEDGVELLLAPEDAGDVWDALLDEGVVPCGLAARDTLRLEVCFHLYGNDMDETRNPIEAGLGWACKEETAFVGSEVVAAARASGTPERLCAFVLTGPGIPRQGNPIVGGGVVTSGTLSPCLETGIGMGYLPAASAEPGTAFEIDVRGRTRAAEVRPKPLYRKES
jgi:aminomethyltransferase